MANKPKLTKLDQQISRLQSDLFDLYRQRQTLFCGTADYPTALRAATTETSASADAEYDRLAAEWAAREATLPARRTLIKKIKSGLVIIEQLAQELNVSPELFTLVAIPPTKLYSTSELAHDRLMQPHIRYTDKYDTPFRPKPQSEWKLLAVYDGLEGLDFGAAAEMVAQQSHIINGINCAALGPREYAIYALAHTGRRDTDWVWLLGNNQKNQVWSVRYLSGAYRFTLDDSAGIGQGELFRPAVEIA